MLNGYDFANFLACGFGCLPIRHVGCSAVKEIVDLSAVEGLGGVGGKVVLIDRASGSVLQGGIAVDQLVKQLSVVCDNVGHIIAVLESSFNLEGGYACLYHFGKI